MKKVRQNDLDLCRRGEKLEHVPGKNSAPAGKVDPDLCRKDGKLKRRNILRKKRNIFKSQAFPERKDRFKSVPFLLSLTLESDSPGKQFASPPGQYPAKQLTWHGHGRSGRT